MPILILQLDALLLEIKSKTCCTAALWYTTSMPRPWNTNKWFSQFSPSRFACPDCYLGPHEDHKSVFQEDDGRWARKRGWEFSDWLRLERPALDCCSLLWFIVLFYTCVRFFIDMVIYILFIYVPLFRIFYFSLNRDPMSKAYILSTTFRLQKGDKAPRCLQCRGRGRKGGSDPLRCLLLSDGQSKATDSNRFSVFLGPPLITKEKAKSPTVHVFCQLTKPITFFASSGTEPPRSSWLKNWKLKKTKACFNSWPWYIPSE